MAPSTVHGSRTSPIAAAHELAVTQRDQGDYPAARATFDDVLTQRRALLGQNHPDTSCAAVNLAHTVWISGDYPAARAMFDDVLTRSRQILGEEHPLTTAVRNALANFGKD